MQNSPKTNTRVFAASGSILIAFRRVQLNCVYRKDQTFQNKKHQKLLKDMISSYLYIFFDANEKN